jgi:hypothetical protein
MGNVEYARTWLSDRSLLSVIPLISIGIYVKLLHSSFSNNQFPPDDLFQIIYLFLLVFLHPLRRIPGQFLAKVTPLLLVYQCRRVRRSEWVLQQHRKYGDTVRIAPNHVSIANPEAVNQIYGYKGGFTKGPFYQDMYSCSTEYPLYWPNEADFTRDRTVPAGSSSSIQHQGRGYSFSETKVSQSCIFVPKFGRIRTTNE